ncbi:hypothetical protein B7494_g3761 [Chlorociboria aeruginascens]|nr:hypothetical protein B7494_g3761 [Chlorociboria aeruginascens]
MADTIPLKAYKETRLNLDSTIQGSTVAIRLPTHGATWPSRTAQKRPHIFDIPIAEDEEAFRQRHLATSASIYHRKHHISPRSFLWRVLEDGKVLSIRVVEVTKQHNTADSNITLRLVFPSPIKPACVAFSDSSEHDVLSAFVVTESYHLYTLSLRPDYFRKQSSTEDNVRDWCKSFAPSAFTFKHPHRLATLSADEILFSLYDGCLLKLDRKPGGDGSEWRETSYNEAGWSQGLRSLIPFQGNNNVRWGKHNMELSAVISISSPQVLLNGVPYVFTVSLDHRLRVWNMLTGRITYMGDILGHELELNENKKPSIHPSHSQLICVSKIADGALCVTYTPIGTGQFKFWNVSPAEESELDVIDLFPDINLEPRAPTSDLWTLADFSAAVDRVNPHSLNLWILWKNNTSYRVQKLEFEVGPTSRALDAWNNGWKSMVNETRADTPVVLPADPSDATDKWLDYILFPGKFSTPTIETGLAIYEHGLGSSKNSSTRKSNHLAERMCSIIASTVTLARASNGSMDHDQFRAATDAQWRRFYRLLSELDKQRGEALSLVIDERNEMPWIISADGISAIRTCSRFEEMYHNPDTPPQGTEHVTALVIAAEALGETISDQLVYSCNDALLEELFGEESQIDPVRMRLFYNKCDLANQIGDEEYAQLVSNLGGDFKNVTTYIYESLFKTMTASEDFDKRLHLLPLGDFGKRLIVKGVQETTELHRKVCFHQLILLILIEAEINHGEEGTQFETAEIFRQLVSMLQRLELISWLAKTQISLPLARSERSNSITDKPSTLISKQVSHTESITVLEGVLRHLFGFETRGHESISSALTEIVIKICAPDSEYEAPPAVTQCFLLKHERPDLAIEFSRFASQDAFSTYIQGRACLAANDAFRASKFFKKAGFGMGMFDPSHSDDKSDQILAYPDPKKRTDHRSAGYLDETEKNLLNNGLPAYYSHIVALYDKERAFSFVADFARLAIQCIKSNDDEPQAILLRAEMHSRLFNAAIQTSRYDMAYSVLALFTDPALQHSSLRTLITKMCETSSSAQLVDLPFIGLQNAVDEILAQKCESIVDVTVGVPYHKILYAWRIKRSDFRGAAAISLERLQKLQQSGDGDQILGDDGLETPITKQYVALINALSCVDPEQAWILSEELPPKGSNTKNGVVPAKRKVVTLADIRKWYQEELDRIAAIENNQFAFAGGDEMDVL